VDEAWLAEQPAGKCVCLRLAHAPPSCWCVPPRTQPHVTSWCTSPFRCLQSLVFFPGNHAVCTPGQPGNYTTLTGTASGGSGGGTGGGTGSGSGSGSSYRVVDVFFTTLNTAYMACYS
jgi:hypothetical protein